MVTWKYVFTRYPLHASAVNAIRHFRLSLKGGERKARRRQKQIESKLTRDLFAKSAHMHVREMYTRTYATGLQRAGAKM